MNVVGVWQTDTDRDDGVAAGFEDAVLPRHLLVDQLQVGLRSATDEQLSIHRAGDSAPRAEHHGEDGAHVTPRYRTLRRVTKRRAPGLRRGQASTRQLRRGQLPPWKPVP